MLRSHCHHKGLEALGQGQGSTGMWGRIALLDLFLKSKVNLQCVHFWCTAKWFRYLYVYQSVCISFQIIFHCILLQGIEYTSLCYTVSPCCLSILFFFFFNISLATQDLSTSTQNLHFIMWDLLLLCIDSLVVACELSCFMECGVFPDHGLKWCPSTARWILNLWTMLRKETSFSWQLALDTNTMTPGFWQHLEKAEGKNKTL